MSWPTWRSSKWSHQSRIILSVLSSTFLIFFFICVTLWETITEARKVELRGPPTEEEPLYKQFITLLRPVSPIPSYVSLPLSPPLCLFLLLLKKKKKKSHAASLPPCKLLICLPPMLSSLGLLSNPGAESCGSVLAYGYLTSASPLIRLSSLNDATCGATNATEKSIKAFH